MLDLKFPPFYLLLLSEHQCPAFLAFLRELLQHSCQSEAYSSLPVDSIGQILVLLMCGLVMALDSGSLCQLVSLAISQGQQSLTLAQSITMAYWFLCAFTWAAMMNPLCPGLSMAFLLTPAHIDFGFSCLLCGALEVCTTL